MRWTTPAEAQEMIKDLIGLLCYIAMTGIVGWIIGTATTAIQETAQKRRRRKAAQAERARLEAYRRYNERMEILNDPDYYGEI